MTQDGSFYGTKDGAHLIKGKLYFGRFQADGRTVGRSDGRTVWMPLQGALEGAYALQGGTLKGPYSGWLSLVPSCDLV